MTNYIRFENVLRSKTEQITGVVFSASGTGEYRLVLSEELEGIALRALADARSGLRLEIVEPDLHKYIAHKDEKPVDEYIAVVGPKWTGNINGQQVINPHNGWAGVAQINRLLDVRLIDRNTELGNLRALKHEFIALALNYAKIELHISPKTRGLAEVICKNLASTVDTHRQDRTGRIIAKEQTARILKNTDASVLDWEKIVVLSTLGRKVSPKVLKAGGEFHFVSGSSVWSQAIKPDDQARWTAISLMKNVRLQLAASK